MVSVKCSVKDEQELTHIIKLNPDSIEEGLRVIETFFNLPNGKQIDVLAMAKDNVLTIIELKKEIDEGQLIQTLNYYDWILSNLDSIKRIFPQSGFALKNPRIILIAEDYREDTLLLSKYLSEQIDITLYRYIAIKVNDKKLIICNEQAIPTTDEIFIPATEEDRVNYILDNDVKKRTIDC